MASHIARDGRRRRVLHDEARSAAGQLALTSMSTHNGAEAPRYGELAGVEHHPQITDYVPRRKRAVLATLACGGAVAAIAQTATHFADSVSAATPGVSGGQIAQVVGGVTAWTSAVALLTIAGLARLVFSLRRHRIEDVRGQYRVWRWIGWSALAASINAVAGFHTVVSTAAVAATGWSLTTTGAEWWLVPTALVAGWLSLRLLREASESRGASAVLMLAVASYAAAAAGSLGWAPAALGPWQGALTTAAPLVGHTLALVAMMIFARYVVLDVQGLVDHAPRTAKQPKKQKAPKPEPVQKPSAATIAVAATTTRREQAPAAQADLDEEADDEDQDGQYLSKSERKRLRKQQQQRRAA